MQMKLREQKPNSEGQIAKALFSVQPFTDPEGDIARGETQLSHTEAMLLLQPETFYSTDPVFLRDIFPSPGWLYHTENCNFI